jgi:hypothetical protein
MISRRWIICSIILSVCLLSGILSSCSTAESKSAAKVAEALSLAEKYIDSWIDKDSAALSSFLSDDLIGFDAQRPKWSYNIQFSNEMLANPSFWNEFQIHKGTMFSSQDGRIVAILAPIDFFTGNMGRVPNAHIIAMKDNKVVFAYDYYGGAISKTEPLPVLEPSTVEPGSPEAKKLIRQADKTMRKWQKAFNDRDTEAYLSCYAGDSRYIDLVKPEWRIMTKDELAEDTLSRFARSEFESRLEASDKSPITGGFFLSADGHYAAAQGTYKDKGVSAAPMMSFLKIEAGKIVGQYNYMLVERKLLQP